MTSHLGKESPTAGRTDIIRQDLGSLAGDYGTLALGYVAVAIFSILATALMTKLLGAEGYGGIALFMMVAQAAMFFSAGWTGAAAICFGREEFDREGRIARTFWARSAILLAGFSLSGGVCLAFQRQVTAYIGLPGWGIWIVLVYALAVGYTSSLHQAFQAIRRIKYISLLQLSDKAALVAILYGASWLSLAHKPQKIALFLTLAAFAAALLGLVLMGKRVLTPLVVSRTAIWEILTFSWPLLLSSALLYAANWADIVVMYLLNNPG